ncbi:MAG TPA: M56 family metallopeptidase, partial [Flavobacterium sp.]
METLFSYLIKSSGLIVLFYLAYFFTLRKETFFTSNRWFLLAGLFTAVLLPFVFITKIIWVEPAAHPINWSSVPVTNYTPEKTFEDYFPVLMALAYGIGILLLLLKFVVDFYSLNSVLRGKSVQQQADFKFLDVAENVAPFSYFNTIVYNSSLYSASELENILEHEKVHSEQNHTIDVLISRLFCIVFWFNPFIWLYKKAILQNLEFIADHEATKKISDKKAYQITLLKITTHKNCVAITNHFYQSLIKKRIVMLNKNQSKKRNSWKYALVLPL